MRETRRKDEYRRGEAVLYKAGGLSYRAVAKRMRTSYSAVYNWVQRYRRGGVEALKTKPHPGGKPRITKDQRKTIVETALKSPIVF
ncbi:helix-turn-helix domain-containing protein [Candidatus Bathyarchaeota archaeon]|nr:helix-turn-helix domain-containing protein [Candidatus Bathyarchaeota archaeon]